MGRVQSTLLAVFGSIAIAACANSSSSSSSNGGSNGGNGSNGGGSTTPPPSSSANPCSTADTAEVAAVGALLRSGLPPPDKSTIIDGGYPRGRAYGAIALHRIAEAARATARPAAVTPGPHAADVGDIAVLQDTGELVVPQNAFDLAGTGLRFSPGGSGYSVSKIDATFRSPLGSRVTLGDDDSAQMTVPFPFSYYGATQTNAFVNSDGNITFGQGDNSSSDRSLGRMLSGAPRVSPFFADLDPTQGTGKIFVNAAADQFTVTWCSVRGYGVTQTVTVQASLLPDGSVEIKFDPSTSLGDAIVGTSPGNTTNFTAVNLSGGSGSGSAAVGERFATTTSIDTVAVAQTFYATHPDTYDQLLYWTDQSVVSGGTFSYEETVANAVQGIGQDVYDLTSFYGSAGKLRSVVVMDTLTKFPDDPTQKFLGENNTLSVMGQEVGHLWLAYMQFRDHTGATSNALLGRDLAHWSFFLNTDASVMEGNQIQDLGGGSFQTVDAVRRYSALDQYAMGLLGAGDVPSFFYVENPVTTKTPGSAPQIGVTLTGTRRDVLITDVVAVEGPRLPSVADSPRTHRQAFVYIVGNGRTPDPTQIAKLDKIRQQWTAFFLQATDGHMTAITTLH
jgi:hypothetical protein